MCVRRRSVEVFGGDEDGKLTPGEMVGAGAAVLDQDLGPVTTGSGAGEVDSVQIVTFEDEDGEVIEEWGASAALSLIEFHISCRSCSPIYSRMQPSDFLCCRLCRGCRCSVGGRLRNATG